MGARCFTWNNWRSSGKCEKPCEGARAPAKGWRLFHVEHLNSMEAQTMRLRGAGLSQKDSGPAFRDRRFQLRQARNCSHNGCLAMQMRSVNAS